MNNVLGILAAVVLGTAACGATHAGDWCDYPHHDRDWRPSYDHGADGGRDRFEAYRGEHAGPRARLLPGDCGDFTYRDWLPHHQTYAFWSPRDKGWYYWCSATDGYLPYDQFEAHPPKPDTIPKMPKGLPPLAPGGVDREFIPPGQDLMPPALPDDAPFVPEGRRFHPAFGRDVPAH